MLYPERCLIQVFDKIRVHDSANADDFVDDFADNGEHVESIANLNNREPTFRSS